MVATTFRGGELFEPMSPCDNDVYTCRYIASVHISSVTTARLPTIVAPAASSLFSLLYCRYIASVHISSVTTTSLPTIVAPAASSLFSFVLFLSFYFLRLIYIVFVLKQE